MPAEAGPQRETPDVAAPIRSESTITSEAEDASADEPKLATRIACLDTEVLVGANYWYNHGNLLLLTNWVRRGRLQLVTTDVIDSEVRAGIRTRIEKALVSMRKAKDTTILLNDDTARPYIDSKDTSVQGVVERRLVEQYERFLLDAEIEVVSTREVQTGLIMDRYRALIPPFEDREAKKHEFPDAISLEGLATWARARGERLYVVSGDKGVRAACEHVTFADVLLPLANEADLLALITRAEPDTPVPDAMAAFSALRTEIATKLGEEFARVGFLLADQEGDVLDVTADDVQLQDYDLVDLTAADESHWTATFEVNAEVGYEAEVSYDDPGAIKWDEGERYVFNTIETTLTRSESISATVTLEFNPMDLLSAAEIEAVAVDQSMIVSVLVGEYDPFDY